MSTILLVEDDGPLRARLALYLDDEGFEVDAVDSAESALTRLAIEPPDLLLADVRLGGMSGVDLIGQLQAEGRLPPTIVISGEATLTETVRALRLGVLDLLEKPFSREKLVQSIRTALELATLRRRVRDLEEGGAPPILGDSGVMVALREQIARAASTSARVLILGESGTGKELVADALHRGSPRRERPFVRVNCAAIPESLIEAELFGHARGAFTDARRARRGLFEEADGGTLFLDEIGDMEPALQARLLRVLEDGRVRRLGEDRDRSVDVRVIAATHRRLDEQDGFRSDLYYRLAHLVLEVPPLHERAEDVPLLAAHFLEQAARRHRLRPRTLEPEAIERLCSYHWPGNVRELASLCERLVVLAGENVSLADLPAAIASAPASPEPAESGLLRVAPSAPALDLKTFRRVTEREYLEEILRRTRWNVTRAAEILDTPRTHLHERIRKLGIERPGLAGDREVGRS